ncbi:hypothetical protein GCM10027048_28720 [Hymenobacter coalescens]
MRVHPGFVVVVAQLAQKVENGGKVSHGRNKEKGPLPGLSKKKYPLPGVEVAAAKKRN